MLVLSVVVILLMCELAARAVAQRLPEPQGWKVREIETQATRIYARSQAEQTCVAFVGSSVLGAAIDPAAMTSGLGHDDWYVAWVAGGNASVLSPWTQEVVFPQLRPEFVVIGVTSFELNDGFGTGGLLKSYFESPGRRRAMGSPSVRDRVEDGLSKFSTLVSMRPYLRSPAELVARLTGRIPPMAPPHGEEPDARDASYGSDVADLRRVAGWVTRYSTGGREADALERLIKGLQERGAAVALVDLPVLDVHWNPLHEHGSLDTDDYRRVLTAIAERGGVPLFSYAGKLQDEQFFRDPIHLNGDGSEVFSDELARQLADWVEASGRSCGSDPR